MTTERIVLSKKEVLRRFAPPDDIPDEVLEKIIPLLEEETFPTGHRIAIQGEPGNAMYFIAAGTVSVTRSPFGIGAPQEIAHLFRGDLVGEMALVNNQPRSATVTPLDEVITYTLKESNWIYIQAFYPGLSSRVKEIAKRREEYNLGRLTQ